VDDHRAVADKGLAAGCEAGVEVEVEGLEGVLGDVAVLAREVADLAALLALGQVARGLLTTVLRVQMGSGTRAVSVGGHRRLVHMVDERASPLGKLEKLMSHTRPVPLSLACTAA